jgi:hypothetical protein
MKLSTGSTAQLLSSVVFGLQIAQSHEGYAMFPGSRGERSVRDYLVGGQRDYDTTIKTVVIIGAAFPGA